MHWQLLLHRKLKYSAFDARSETGKRYSVRHLLSAFAQQAPVVQTLESAIRQINHYPLGNKWLLK